MKLAYNMRQMTLTIARDQTIYTILYTVLLEHYTVGIDLLFLHRGPDWCVTAPNVVTLGPISVYSPKYSVM